MKIARDCFRVNNFYSISTEDGTGIHRSRKGLEIQEGHPVLLMDSHSEGCGSVVSQVMLGLSAVRVPQRKVKANSKPANLSHLSF